MASDHTTPNSCKRKQTDSPLTPYIRGSCEDKALVAKKETLRQLKLVQFYREKHNLSQLEMLIDQWTLTCQQALEQLQERVSRADAAVSIGQLLNALGIEPELVRYDEEAEDFIQDV